LKKPELGAGAGAKIWARTALVTVPSPTTAKKNGGDFRKSQKWSHFSTKFCNKKSH
jgi:hypothetical protein